MPGRVKSLSLFTGQLPCSQVAYPVAYPAHRLVTLFTTYPAQVAYPAHKSLILFTTYPAHKSLILFTTYPAHKSLILFTTYPAHVHISATLFVTLFVTSRLPCPQRPPGSFVVQLRRGRGHPQAVELPKVSLEPLAVAIKQTKPQPKKKISGLTPPGPIRPLCLTFGLPFSRTTPRPNNPPS
jgi:hypothetical protein